jgi:hypothetical protein
MDYISNFLNTNTLLKIYILTNDDYYKKKVENLLDTNLYYFESFVSKSYNIIIDNNITILCIDNKIYITDKNNNNIEILLNKNKLIINTLRIFDVKAYYTMYIKFKNMFIDIQIGKYKISKNNNLICYYKHLIIQNKFSIYCDNKLYKII